MNLQLVAVIQTYPWQCMECKTCIICRDPFDEVSTYSIFYLIFFLAHGKHCPLLTFANVHFICSQDKMLFCDECDRGYHSFCVGLKQIPVGKFQ